MAKQLKQLKQYDVQQKAGEDIQHYYRRLAKAADERLVRLEKLSQQKGFGDVDKFSYKMAMHDIRHWSGDQAKRFNRVPPKNQTSLLAKIADIKKFLESTTSTKTGIIDMYVKRTNTINENYGTTFSWQDLARYFETESNKKMEKYGGSDTAFRTIGEIQKLDKKVVEDIKAKKNATDAESILSGISDPILKEKVAAVLTDKKMSDVVDNLR